MIDYGTRENDLMTETSAEVSHEHINDYLAGVQTALATVSPAQVAAIVEVLLDAAQTGKMIFICGNGGSASTASHMACDLGKGCRMPGFPSFKAIALTDSMSQVTAWANDTSYENCFSGQLEGLASPGDVLVSISGSGNSPNVLKAVEVAKTLGMTTIGWSGFKGGKLAGMVDYGIVTPASNIETVEDLHMILEHTVSTTLRRTIQARTGQYSEGGC